MFILFWLQNESNLPICQWVSEKGVVIHCICEILFGCFFFFTGHQKGGKMQSLCQFCVFTHVASIYAILLKQKKRLHKKSSTSTGLVWDTNMAAVSLFWDTNMAVVTSCENTQYIHESRSQKQTFCRTFLFHMSSCFCRTATLRFFNILRRHSLHIL